LDHDDPDAVAALREMCIGTFNSMSTERVWETYPPVDQETDEDALRTYAFQTLYLAELGDAVALEEVTNRIVTRMIEAGLEGKFRLKVRCLQPIPFLQFLENIKFIKFSVSRGEVQLFPCRSGKGVAKRIT